MDWTVRLGDVAIVFATLLGPVMAVQAQKVVERGQQQAQRRIGVFRTLMATRRQLLSQAHVEALNIVPIEFYAESGKRAEIIDAWEVYINHLYVDETLPGWGDKRAELLNNLLEKMGKYLGFRFNSAKLSREVYSPKGHATVENDQEVIRRGLARLFRGETVLPLAIKSFDSDPTLLASQLDLQSKMREWLEGKREVKMSFTGRSAGNDPTT